MSTRPLSAYNVCYQIQQDICDIMNQSPVILSAGIKFIAEDSQYVDYQIKESLKKQGMAAVVMTPSLNYLGHNGNSEAYQLNDLIIQFVEYTPINRASNRDVVCTGIDLANYTSELLAGPNSVIGFGKMTTDGIEQGEDGGLLVTKLTFSIYIENGDTGPIIYIPFVTREEMEDYVGNGKLTFTRDGTQIGSFTANQKNDISVEIPNGVGGVSKIIAGSNITISPDSGTGEVTISASGGGGDIPANLSVDHLSANVIMMGGNFYPGQQKIPKNSIVMGSGSYAFSYSPNSNDCSKLAIGYNAQTEGYNAFAIGSNVKADGVNNAFALGNNVGTGYDDTFIWGGTNYVRHYTNDTGHFCLWSDVYDAKDVLQINGQTLGQLFNHTYIYSSPYIIYSGSGYNYIGYSQYLEGGKTYLVFGYLQCDSTHCDAEIYTVYNGQPYTAFKSCAENTSSNPIMPFSFVLHTSDYYFHINTDAYVNMFVTMLVEIGEVSVKY